MNFPLFEFEQNIHFHIFLFKIQILIYKWLAHSGYQLNDFHAHKISDDAGNNSNNS